MARRAAQDAFFKASLLCGLAIIVTIYVADPKAAPAPLVSVDAGRKLLQARGGQGGGSPNRRAAPAPILTSVPSL